MEIEAGQIAEAIDEAVEEVTPGQAMRVAAHRGNFHPVGEGQNRARQRKHEHGHGNDHAGCHFARAWGALLCSHVPCLLFLFACGHPAQPKAQPDGLMRLGRLRRITPIGQCLKEL